MSKWKEQIWWLDFECGHLLQLKIRSTCWIGKRRKRIWTSKLSVQSIVCILYEESMSCFPSLKILSNVSSKHLVVRSSIDHLWFGSCFWWTLVSSALDILGELYSMCLCDGSSIFLLFYGWVRARFELCCNTSVYDFSHHTMLLFRQIWKSWINSYVSILWWSIWEIDRSSIQLWRWTNSILLFGNHISNSIWNMFILFPQVVHYTDDFFHRFIQSDKRNLILC